MLTRKTSPFLPTLFIGMAVILTMCKAQQWQPQWDVPTGPANVVTTTPANPASQNSWTQQHQNVHLDPSMPMYADVIQQQFAQLQAMEAETAPRISAARIVSNDANTVNERSMLNAAPPSASTSSHTTATSSESNIDLPSLLNADPQSFTTSSPISARRAEQLRDAEATKLTKADAESFKDDTTDADNKVELHGSDPADAWMNQSPEEMHQRLQALAILAKDDANTVRSACNIRCTERLIDVSGVGTVTIGTSQALVRSVIEIRSADTDENSTKNLTPEEASAAIEYTQRNLSERSQRVVAYLNGEEFTAKISKLTTTNIQMQPIYTYKDGRQILRGYRSSVTISFQIDIPTVSEVLSGIIERGVTSIESVSFVPSDDELNQARQESIRRAVVDALAQANSSISGLGDNIGLAQLIPLQIVSLNVLGVTQPQATPMVSDVNLGMFAKRQEAMSLPPLTVMSDEKTVRATVLAKIRF